MRWVDLRLLLCLYCRKSPHSFPPPPPLLPLPSSPSLFFLSLSSTPVLLPLTPPTAAALEMSVEDGVWEARSVALARLLLALKAQSARGNPSALVFANSAHSAEAACAALSAKGQCGPIMSRTLPSAQAPACHVRKLHYSPPPPAPQPLLFFLRSICTFPTAMMGIM